MYDAASAEKSCLIRANNQSAESRYCTGIITFYSLTTFIDLKQTGKSSGGFFLTLKFLYIFIFTVQYTKLTVWRHFFFVSENCDSHFLKHILEIIMDQCTQNMAAEWTVFLWSSCSCCRHQAFSVLVLLLIFLRYNHAKIFNCAVAVPASCNSEWIFSSEDLWETHEGNVTSFLSLLLLAGFKFRLVRATCILFLQIYSLSIARTRANCFRIFMERF